MPITVEPDQLWGRTGDGVSHQESLLDITPTGVFSYGSA